MTWGRGRKPRRWEGNPKAFLVLLHRARFCRNRIIFPLEFLKVPSSSVEAVYPHCSGGRSQHKFVLIYSVIVYTMTRYVSKTVTNLTYCINVANPALTRLSSQSLSAARCQKNKPPRPISFTYFAFAPTLTLLSYVMNSPLPVAKTATASLS